MQPSPMLSPDQENNLLINNIFDDLPTAVYTVDRDGYITSFNKAAVELWGRAPVLGVDLWFSSVNIYDADGRRLAYENCPLARCLQTGASVDVFEIIIERPDGTRRNVLPHPVPSFNASGKLTGAVNTLVDITEQRIVESRQTTLAAIIESSHDAIIGKNLDGIIHSWNNGATEIFGYSEQEALGRHVKILIPEDHLYEEEIIIHKIRKGEKIDQYETVRRNKAGELLVVSLTVSPIKDRSGRITGASKIVRNITRQKLLEDRKVAYDQAVKARNETSHFARQLNDVLEEERKRISRELHDEFGQRLIALKMSLGVLSQSENSIAEQDELITSMREDLDKAIQSVRKIATELRPSIIDTLGLGSSIEWLAMDFRRKFKVNCLVTVEDKEIVVAKSMAICYFRICQEALTNVIKHSGADQVKIQLKKTNNALVLTIEDNGRGMSIDKIETPFSMGLLGMRERAHLIGGILSINSSAQGTLIRLEALSV